MRTLYKQVGSATGFAAALLLPLCLLGASVLYAAASPPLETTVPAGRYTIDSAHSSLLFRVSHMGFSWYTARFTQFDIDLAFDPVNVEKSRLQVSVKASSLETDNRSSDYDFNGILRGPDWLDAEQYPAIDYRSTSIESTGANALLVRGELTLHGVTKPVDLQVRFNGGYPGLIPYDPAARIGFSATGSLLRSQFGITAGIPPKGSTFGVGDLVEIIVETELTGPTLKQ